MKRLTVDQVDNRLAKLNIVRLSPYVNLNTPFELQCTGCNTKWINKPDRVIGKKQIGCPTCNNRQKMTNERIDANLPPTIQRVSDCTGTHDPIELICLDCSNKWKQTPGNLMYRKSGCIRCSNNYMTNDRVDNTIIGRQLKRVGDVYNTSSRIEWKCERCDNVWCASPSSVINERSGCPKCAKLISKKEIEWLDRIGVPNSSTSRQVILNLNGTKYKVDGYVPDTNTVYEFWGDFWHGNPSKYDHKAINPITKETYGHLYHKTQLKRDAILAAGYNLVEIWESEWAQLSSAS